MSVFTVVLHARTVGLNRLEKLQKGQHLTPEDPPRRLEFCQWLINRVENDPNFLSNVLVSDEKGFSREGTFNPHNNHHWSEENPHQTFIRGYPQKFSINLWAGIGDHLLGPYVLPDRLNANNYLVFLQEVLPDLLEDVPLNLYADHWFRQDGCPAHFGVGVLAHLDAEYPNRWIGRGGPVPWPPRSPDLTPLDFFLWGAMEQLVYVTPVESVEDLIARVVMAAEEIR